MPRSPSITYAVGTGRPEAMDISSTTLRNTRSLGSRVRGSTRRPPMSPATALPPLRSCAVRTRLPPPMRSPIPVATARNRPGWKSLSLPNPSTGANSRATTATR